MAKADNPAFEQGQSPRTPLPASVPLLIVGGGIMGLWAAVKAERLGIDTLLVEADHP
ncbi:D-amino-acid oxidase, partial [Mesorhizobium sp. M4B.F.Ca.ET.214.01.1.1]